MSHSDVAIPGKLKIFISYSRADKHYVRGLYHLLRTIGYEPWFDEESLLPGQDWELQVATAIEAAHIVLVCLSSKSVNKSGYLQKEIREAIKVAEQQPEGALFLVPVRLEECPMPKKLKMWQWVDMFSEQSRVKLLAALNLKAATLGLSTVAPEALLEYRYRTSDKEYMGDRATNTTDRDLAGDYVATGKNNNGTSYLCRVTITKETHFYVVTWYVADSVRISRGIPKDGLFTVFGDYLVVYHVNADGTMDGFWGDSGTERLVPSDDERVIFLDIRSTGEANSQ